MPHKLPWDQFKDLNDEQRLFLFYEALVDASELKNKVINLEKKMQTLNQSINGDPDSKNGSSLIERVKTLEDVINTFNKGNKTTVQNVWNFVGGIIGGITAAFAILKFLA